MQRSAPRSLIHVVAAVLAVTWVGNAVVALVAAQTRGRAEELRQAVRAVEREQVVREAIRAADRYLETWNTRDPIAWPGPCTFLMCGPGSDRSA